MRTRIRTRGLQLALSALVLGAPSAHAQGYISAFLGNNFGGDAGCQSATSCESPASNLGVALGRGNVVVFEEELLYARDFFGKSATQSTNLITLSSNIVVGPRIGYVRPYGLIGLGFMKARAKLSASQLTSSDTNLDWNLGAGLEVAGKHLGVRGDIRQVHALQNITLPGLPISGLKLDFNRASAGIILRF